MSRAPRKTASKPPRRGAGPGDGAEGGEAKRGPGRPKKGPRALPNKRRGGRYDILGLGEPFKTDVFTEGEALVIMAQMILAHDEGRQWVSPDVPLRDVFAKCGHVARNGSIYHLLRFFGDAPLSSITRDACWAYAAARKEEGESDEAGAAKASTIDNELSNLRNVVNMFCRGLKLDPPTVYMVGGHAPARDFLKVRDVERLLVCAAEGRVWDAAMGDWRRLPDGSFELKDADWRASVSAMPRLVALAVWTGSRADVPCRATWSKRPGRPQIDFRTGVLRRRGSAEPVTSKGRPPVRLAPEILELALSWAAEDAEAGIDDVVHDARGAPVGDRAWRAFAMVREAAGLPESVTLRTLRASCAVWLMENGCTPEQAADFLGNTKLVLTRFYDRYVPEFSHAAVDALDSRSYAPMHEVARPAANSAAVQEAVGRRSGDNDAEKAR